jgi:hypothetical protein
LARCLAAVFLSRPDLSYRFPRKIFSDRSIADVAFSQENHEAIYYACCLLYYRMAILFSNQQLPSDARKFKWHIMSLFARRVGGSKMPTLRDRKIEKWCSKIIDVILNDPKECKRIMNSCYDAFKALGDVSDDRLKRQAVYDQVLKNESPK